MSDKYPRIFRDGAGFFLAERWGDSVAMTPLVNFLHGCAMAGAAAYARRLGQHEGWNAGWNAAHGRRP